MKRLLVSAAAIVAALGLMAPAHATGVAKATQEGPYGPVQFQDYGTCTNTWADTSQKTTYYVPKKSKDGTYQVQFDLAGTFSSIAGQSPGACNSGTDNGNTVSKGIKGKMVQNFHIVVSGGKFNPKAKCSDTCATDYTFDGVNTFVSTFFKGGASWTFSSTKLTHELVTSTDKKLCAKKWELDYDPATGIISNPKGDIATKCH
jgi:hypothetical protein